MAPHGLLRTLRAALLGLAAGFGIAAGAAAQEPLTPAQIEAFENVIRDYLLRNPEVILEAVRGLEARQQELEAERARQAIGERQDELLHDPMAPVVGAPDAPITVVEFFDYRCPYCKSVAAGMVKTLEAEGDVRIVFKEFPILGPESVYAAKAALAAERQGKYGDFHLALMVFKGQLDTDAVLRVAERVGLDVGQMKADMEAPEIQAALDRNLELAEALGIRGTPAFVIGEQMIPGAIDMTELRRLVRTERSG